MPSNVSDESNYYPILPIVSSSDRKKKNVNDIRNKKNSNREQYQPITVMLPDPFYNMNNNFKKKSVTSLSLVMMISILILTYCINFVFMFLHHHHHQTKISTMALTNHTATTITTKIHNSNKNYHNMNIIHHHEQKLQKEEQKEAHGSSERWVLYRSIQEQVTIHSKEIDVLSEYCYYNDTSYNFIMLRDVCNDDIINNSMKILYSSSLDDDEDDDTIKPKMRGTLLNNPEEDKIQDQAISLHNNRSHYSNSLHCVSTTDHSYNNNEEGIVLKSLDQSWDVTAWDVLIQRVDWPWALILIIFWCILSYRHIIAVTKRIQKSRTNTSFSNDDNHATWKHRLQWTVLYLMMIIIYKKVQTGKNNSFWISTTITTVSSLLSFLETTIVESYYAFTIVHPIDDNSSQLLLLSHIGTYWFQLGAWFYAKNLRQFLLFYIGYELVTSFCNEYLHHHDEMDIGIKCTRISFISTTKQYAIDDTIRAYLLPPFFVYFSLLPKLIIAFCFGK